MSRPQERRTRTGQEPEQVLVGGTANRGLVVRVGDTVRRPVRPESGSTHALFRHLQEVGFPGAPRYVGHDGSGREVLSFIEGTAALPPYPDWALDDAALQSVATLLRGFHDATEGFRAGHMPWSVTVGDAYRTGSVVCHGDPNLDNVVFRDGRAVGLIDFDLAAPGSRIWDVAAAVRLWAPLRAEEDIADSRAGRVVERATAFVHAYGLARADRRRFVDAVLAHHDWAYEIVRTSAVAGHRHFAEYWHRGGAWRAVRSREWVVGHRQALERAMG